jgi:hypothetical protein
VDPPITFHGPYQPGAFLKFNKLPPNEFALPQEAEGHFVRRSITNSSHSGLEPDRRNLAVRIRKMDVQREPGFNGQWLVQKNAGATFANIVKPAASNRPFSPPSRR